ncbi:hypothetical protein FIU87_05465 [Bacillus sp. THAF10]|uniref:hypothetical protein n=1 Tax=Bacillus sp. THAF10 TaxID=2587848 RepID=UPI001267B9EF|nr:hypothetical protein [Bacillus sp. THAF10]QFT88080.1 hypothetical protein FIU87_05465 [Bacillus sp. THAF10]
MITNAFNVKLTDRDVYKILYLNHVKEVPPHQLETMFPVTKKTISKIVNGKSRKDCYAVFIKYKDTHKNEFIKLLD